MRLALAALAVAAASPSLADDPRAAVDALASAMAASDTTAILQAFTDDAGYAYSLEGELIRGDAFDAWVQSDITGPSAVFTIESATVAGNRVDALVLWGRAGIASTPARYVFDIVDGRIDAWRMSGR